MKRRHFFGCVLGLPLLTSPLAAISPHRLRLEQVLTRGDWVLRARVTKIADIVGNHASGLTFEVEILEQISSKAATGQTWNYWEGWPVQVPKSGKGSPEVWEAPIWTGSGLERQLQIGSEFLAIGRGRELLRAEPLSQIDLIRKLLHQVSRSIEQNKSPLHAQE